jgi:putative endonuclease
MAERDEKTLLGPWGEVQAVDRLRAEGYAILACNYRCRLGEIDIIAKDRKFLVFVEVKLRKSDAHGEAREFVDLRKRERIKKTALLYLSQNETALQPRFDVIEIYAPDGTATRRPVIHHLENAFE